MRQVRVWLRYRRQPRAGCRNYCLWTARAAPLVAAPHLHGACQGLGFQVNGPWGLGHAGPSIGGDCQGCRVGVAGVAGHCKAEGTRQGGGGMEQLALGEAALGTPSVRCGGRGQPAPVVSFVRRLSAVPATATDPNRWGSFASSRDQSKPQSHSSQSRLQVTQQSRPSRAAVTRPDQAAATHC